MGMPPLSLSIILYLLCAHGLHSVAGPGHEGEATVAEHAKMTTESKLGDVANMDPFYV
jgi:hypothetical protein